MTRQELFTRGLAQVSRWCRINKVKPPITVLEPVISFGTCAYYRDGMIHISILQCAPIGMAGRSWSYPGYVVDRTPYGVLAHELGHHVDRAHGARPGDWSPVLRQTTGEEAITGYAPNDNEWFAELFRLFVTNPLLLKEIRPETYARMIHRWPHRAEERHWRAVLKQVPRQLQAAENKVIKESRRRIRAEEARA